MVLHRTTRCEQKFYLAFAVLGSEELGVVLPVLSVTILLVVAKMKIHLCPFNPFHRRQHLVADMCLPFRRADIMSTAIYL